MFENPIHFVVLTGFGAMLQREQLHPYLVRLKLSDDYQVEPLVAEASQRRYFRLVWPDKSSLVACLNGEPVDAKKNDFIIISRFLRENKINAPRVLAVDQEAGLIIQSDAGAEDLAFIIKRGTEQTRAAFLKAVIEILVRMQAVEAPPVVKARSFDFEKLFWEISFLFDQVRQTSDTIDVSQYRDFFMNLCKGLSGEPRVFCHRDFHSRNIMIKNRRQIALIDFQDARMGLPYYDLASLVYDPYTDFTEAEMQLMLHYYRTKTPYEFDMVMFKAQAAQRLFKALGTYLHQAHIKKNDAYRPFIGRALDRLRKVVLSLKDGHRALDFIEKLEALK